MPEFRKRRLSADKLLECKFISGLDEIEKQEDPPFVPKDPLSWGLMTDGRAMGMRQMVSFLAQTKDNFVIPFGSGIHYELIVPEDLLN